METATDLNMVNMKVDGTVYGVTVQDFGSHWKLRVYQDDRVIGFRDYPFGVEVNKGLMTFAIRSIAREQNGKATKA